MGLKENVILGHLVPTGTGFKGYHAQIVEKTVDALEPAEMGVGAAAAGGAEPQVSSIKID